MVRIIYLIELENKFQHCAEKFFKLIYDHPLVFFLFIGILGTICTIAAFSLKKIDFEPKIQEAFQTWNTDISKILKAQDKIFEKYSFEPGFNDHKQRNPMPSSISPIVSLIMDRLVDSKCYRKLFQSLLEISEKKNAAELFVVVFEAGNVDELFTPKGMYDLCRFHKYFEATNNQTFVSAFSPIDCCNECEMMENQSRFENLKEETVKIFHKQNFSLLPCKPQSSALCISDSKTIDSSLYSSTCKMLDQSLLLQAKHHYHNMSMCLDELCSNKTDGGVLPQSCSKLTTLLNLAIHENLCRMRSIFLSKNAWSGKSPIFFGSYNGQISITRHYQYFQKVQSFGMKIKGIGMDFEAVQKEFSRLLTRDLFVLGPISLFLVFILLWTYSGSFLGTLGCVFSLLLAFGMSYFLFVIVYQLKFWFIDYLAAIILLGIGADDCFVLFHIMKIIETEEQSSKNFASHLKHASFAMFVTSSTTAIAFLSNVISNVVAVISFGLFAATLVMTAYLMVIIWVPVCYLCSKRYSPHSLTAFFKALPNTAVHTRLRTFKICTRHMVSCFIQKNCFALTGLLLILAIASHIVVFAFPKFEQSNGTPQLFHASHPIGWFMAKYSKEFDIQPYESYEIFNVFWGLKNQDNTNPLNREWKHVPRTYSGFVVDLQFLETQAKLCQYMRARNYSTSCYAEDFLETFHGNMNQSLLHLFQNFSKSNAEKCKNFTTSSDSAELEKNFNEIIKGGSGFHEIPSEYLMHKLELRRTVCSSGPLYETTGKVMGYVQPFSHKDNLSSLGVKCSDRILFYKELAQTLKEASKDFNDDFNQQPWIAPQFNDVFSIGELSACDLQLNIHKGTVPSVLIAMGIAVTVVAVFTKNLKLGLASIAVICTIIQTSLACLVLAKWRLNIVESIIIILCIGLSFDYTLHYAVAYKRTYQSANLIHDRVALMIQEASSPVFFSALSTVIAGIIFCFASTYPFYQLGIFMVNTTCWSWFISTFLFTALMETLDTFIGKVRSCNKLVMKLGNKFGFQNQNYTNDAHAEGTLT